MGQWICDSEPGAYSPETCNYSIYMFRSMISGFFTTNENHGFLLESEDSRPLLERLSKSSQERKLLGKR